MADDRFREHIEDVARLLLGEPNKVHSSRTELRFGTNGSLAIDRKAGIAFDHELAKGGGVLWLIERQTGRKGGAAFQWLKENGFSIEERETKVDHTASRIRDSVRRTVAASQPSRAQRTGGALASVAQDIPRHGSVQRDGLASDDQPSAQGHSRSRLGDAGLVVTATYDYTDENGTLIFQVQRLEGTEDGKKVKSFRQRMPDGMGGWDYKIRGKVQFVPYRLPELLEQIALGNTVFVVEGEKDADNLWRLGVPATTSPGGAGKWPENLTPWFHGADVIVMPDNDPQKHRKERDGTLTPLFHDSGKPMLAGQDHAKHTADCLSMVARVRVLELARHVPLPPKGDVSDWLEQGGNADLLYALVPHAIDGAVYDPAEWFLKQSYKPRFRIESWRDLGKPGVKHEWVVKNLISRGELSMLVGASQAGKSFLTIDLAMAVCRGTDFMGHKVSRRGGVIYQAGEGYAGLRNLRIPAYMKANRISFEDDIPFALLGAAINLWAGDVDTDALIQDILWKAEQLGVPLELVIIDTFAAAMAGANENASDHVGLALARCNRIREATGANVMLVHHMNSAGEKARGHSSLVANLESVLTARVMPAMNDGAGAKIRELEITKQKDGSNVGKSHRFVLRPVKLWKDEDGDDVTSCVIATPGGRGKSAFDDHPFGPDKPFDISGYDTTH